MLSNYPQIYQDYFDRWKQDAPKDKIGDPAHFDLDSETQDFFHCFQRLAIRKYKGEIQYSYWTDHKKTPSLRPTSALNLIRTADAAWTFPPLPDFDWIRVYTGDVPPRLCAIKESPEYTLIPACLDLSQLSPDCHHLEGYRRQAAYSPTRDNGFEDCNLFLNKDFGLCPDFTFWAYGGAYLPTSDGVSGWVNFYRQVKGYSPPSNVRAQMVWRGSGRPKSEFSAQLKNPDWNLAMNAPRPYLRDFSSKYPEILDAKLVNIDGAETRLSPFEMADNYKYILEGGGGGFSARVKWMLFLKRLCFIREKAWPAFYEINLKPYIHYIPIKQDFSDLLDKYQWAEDNPDKCQEIIDNCFKFAETFLSPYSLNKRWHDIINYIVENYQ